MAETSSSFDELLQQSRKKRQAEQLAQELFGRNRRPRTPAESRPHGRGSIASRVGVNKRPSSVPRLSTPRSNNNSNNNNNPRISAATGDLLALIHENRTKSTSAASHAGKGTFPTTETISQELNIRGAASKAHVLILENLHPMVLEEDVAEFMKQIGAQPIGCRLTTTKSQAVVELAFADEAGANAVVRELNGKKADGRVLSVKFKDSSSLVADVQVEQQPVTQQQQQQQQQQPAAPKRPEPAVANEAMEIDELAEAREAEDRLREERRGRHDRGPRDGFPSGPRASRGYQDDYYGGPRRGEPAYQDHRDRYGGGGRYESRPSYHGGGRPHPNDMGRGGQRWR